MNHDIFKLQLLREEVPGIVAKFPAEMHPLLGNIRRAFFFDLLTERGRYYAARAVNELRLVLRLDLLEDLSLLANQPVETLLAWEPVVRLFLTEGDLLHELNERCENPKETLNFDHAVAIGPVAQLPDGPAVARELMQRARDGNLTPASIGGVAHEILRSRKGEIRAGLDGEIEKLKARVAALEDEVRELSAKVAGGTGALDETGDLGRPCGTPGA